MAYEWPIMTLLQNDVPHLPFQHIESVLLVPHQSILQLEV